MSRLIKLPRRQYKIKPNKKRIEFERILRKIGCKDRSIVKNSTLINVPILRGELLANNTMVSGFYIFYVNKKSFLYNCYLSYKKTMRYKKIIKSLKILFNEINYNEKSRLCEIGWSVELGLKLIHLSPRQRATVYIKVLKFAKKVLKEGNEYFKPRENDMLISKPEGPKKLLQLNKRGKINERLGFGKIKSSRYQYAKYDSNLNLIPV